MSAATYSTTIEQGATWTRVVSFQNPDGTDQDLTGATARMQVRDGQDLLAELSTANGRIAVDGGTLTLTLSAAETALLPVVTAEYDLFLTLGTTDGTVVERPLAGVLPVIRRITRG